jgi:acyl carrier protein
LGRPVLLEAGAMCADVLDGSRSTRTGSAELVAGTEAATGGAACFEALQTWAGLAADSGRPPQRGSDATAVRSGTSLRSETHRVKDQIRTIVKEHGRFAGDVTQLGDEDDLYLAGMTSHASVGVMLALEAAFDIEFPDRMLKRSVFESVSSMAAAVSELLRERN